MCGIVGLYVKNTQLQSDLGAAFAPMLIEMTDRGPDSSGVAVYRNDIQEGLVKITLAHPNENFNWQQLQADLANHIGNVESKTNANHHICIIDGDLSTALDFLNRYDPLLRITSFGNAIEIYKEVGLPEYVIDKFGIGTIAGSHAIGHTRMATESAVTTAGSHPFSTGKDLCLVHNGSLSNHNTIREHLIRTKGFSFETENDTEVAAAWITAQIDDGASLHQALESCLDTLDGFYTFVAGTRNGFAVLRDPIACKPAVLAETDGYVAFASEYRALVNLPNIETAKVWEPEPAIVYSWGDNEKH